MSITCLSCEDSNPEFPTGVAGNESVPFSVIDDKTLVKENALAIELLSCCPCDGVDDVSKFVLSPSGVEFLVLKLHWGRIFLTVGFTLDDEGLGGRPGFVEGGVAEEGKFILAELICEFSRDLAGICREGRLGRLER
ncbi:hypothetical protein M5K25_023414 [Dendrobium thyrsiflorum]|uniref:Uncharacterized protein n=1 Tax=Dendrobium thyrsiflorum TaxID=117978 RepID=A0ABD0UEU5_DENTH